MSSRVPGPACSQEGITASLMEAPTGQAGSLDTPGHMLKPCVTSHVDMVCSSSAPIWLTALRPLLAPSSCCWHRPLQTPMPNPTPLESKVSVSPHTWSRGTHT